MGLGREYCWRTRSTVRRLVVWPLVSYFQVVQIPTQWPLSKWATSSGRSGRNILVQVMGCEMSGDLASGKIWRCRIRCVCRTPLIATFMWPTWGHLGPTGPRWAPCWPQEHYHLGPLHSTECKLSWYIEKECTPGNLVSTVIVDALPPPPPLSGPVNLIHGIHPTM